MPLKRPEVDAVDMRPVNISASGVATTALLMARLATENQ